MLCLNLVIDHLEFRLHAECTPASNLSHLPLQVAAYEDRFQNMPFEEQMEHQACLIAFSVLVACCHKRQGLAPCAWKIVCCTLGAGQSFQGIPECKPRHQCKDAARESGEPIVHGRQLVLSICPCNSSASARQARLFLCCLCRLLP